MARSTCRARPDHGVVVGHHDFLEVVRPLRPDVRRVHLRAGLVDLGGQVGTLSGPNANASWMSGGAACPIE